MMRDTVGLEIVDHLAAAGVRAWLDGGWGVDVPAGEQTRAYYDLDVAVARTDAADVRQTRVVARDPTDRRVKPHTVAFDEGGGGIQRVPDGSGWR